MSSLGLRGVLWLSLASGLRLVGASDAAARGTANKELPELPNNSFAQRLFKDALPLANLSLHGRFINEMADGSLAAEVFKRYLTQDNLYLFKYARAYAALASRSEQNDDFFWIMKKAKAFLEEHGPEANTSITEEDFDREALPVTVAYTDLLLQAVWHEDAVVGFAAVLPCQRLYDWLFATLEASRPPGPGNPYRDFIRQYADPANHRVSEQLEALLDRRAARGLPPGVEARARERYRAAMAFEADFFQQAFAGGGGGGALPLLAATGAHGRAGSGTRKAAATAAAARHHGGVRMAALVAAAALGGMVVALAVLRAAPPRGCGRGSGSAQLLAREAVVCP
uniref:Thiaminase-2/PQQC domain-containing protein n=1 Tax=Alexandrium monilatum TaxID=311494 RepID=A0A7S4SXR1_9DINO